MRLPHLTPGRLAALLCAAALQAQAAPPVLVDEATLARAEPAPYGDIGRTTGYRFFEAVDGRPFDFRKRVFLPGSKMGVHTLTRDQVYAVVSGRGQLRTDSQTHALEAGVTVYAYDGSEIELEQTGAEPLVLLYSWPTAYPKAPPAQRVHESEVRHAEKNHHGGQGASDNFRLFDAAPGRTLTLRKRTLPPGSTVGAHVIARDQVYYVVEGEGELVADGTVHKLAPGVAVYVYDGTRIQIRQTGTATLAYVFGWPHAGRDTRAPAAVASRNASVPVGTTGLTLLAGRRQMEWHLHRLEAGQSGSGVTLGRDHVVYVVEGSGTLEVDGSPQPVAAGHAAYLRAGSRLQFKAGQPLRYFSVAAAAP